MFSTDSELQLNVVTWKELKEKAEKVAMQPTFTDAFKRNMAAKILQTERKKRWCAEIAIQFPGLSLKGKFFYVKDGYEYLYHTYQQMLFALNDPAINNIESVFKQRKRHLKLPEEPSCRAIMTLLAYIEYYGDSKTIERLGDSNMLAGQIVKETDLETALVLHRNIGNAYRTIELPTDDLSLADQYGLHLLSPSSIVNYSAIREAIIEFETKENTKHQEHLLPTFFLDCAERGIHWLNCQLKDLVESCPGYFTPNQALFQQANNPTFFANATLNHSNVSSPLEIAGSIRAWP